MQILRKVNSNQTIQFQVDIQSGCQCGMQRLQEMVHRGVVSQSFPFDAYRYNT